MFQPESKIDLATAIRILLERRQGIGVDVAKIKTVGISHLNHEINVLVSSVSKTNKTTFFSGANIDFTDGRSVGIEFNESVY